MKNGFTTKNIAKIALFTALVIVLQLVGNFVRIANFSIAFGLIPVAVGAMLLGPSVGLWLGLVFGGMTLLTPEAIGTFIPYSAIATVSMCLLKGGLAGLFSGLIYKALSNKKEKLSVVLASIVVPLTNTLVFIAFSLLIFLPLYGASKAEQLETILGFVIGINFLVEFLTISLLIPTIKYLVKILSTR